MTVCTEETGLEQEIVPIAKKQVDIGGVRFTAVFIDTEEKFQRFLDLFESHSGNLVAFDTETDDLYGEIVGLSFAFNQNMGFYIPIGHKRVNIGKYMYTKTGKELKGKRLEATMNLCNEVGWKGQNPQLDREYVMESLRKYFEGDRFRFVCHNVAYEIGVLMKHHRIKINKFHDTMLMANLVNENLPLALKMRSKILFNMTETQDLDDIRGPLSIPETDIERLGTYAIQDVILTLKLFHLMKNDPEFVPFRSIYMGVELRTARVVAMMIYRGLRAVPEIVKEVKEEYTARVAELEKLIFYEASFNPETGKHEGYFDSEGNLHNGLEFNLQSPPQKTKVLIERLQMPIVHRTETGAPSTDSKKALPKWVEMGYKIAEYLLEWSKLTKVLQSYTDGILNALDPNGRIHPSFKQTGAKTGRFSCSNPNFQSMPKKGKIRTAFVPDPGRVLVCSDYSQLELRIAAHFSEDPNMIKAFLDGKDLHVVNAAFMFNKSEEDVTDDERQIAKAIAFGLQYGMGVREDIGVTRDKIDAYFDANVKLFSYMETHKLAVEKQGYTRTILGRKRRIGKVWSKDRNEKAEAFRELFSAHVQGTAADIMKVAMCDIYDDFEREGIDAWIIAQVHDEILVECLEADTERVCEIIKHRMETAIELVVPLEADPGVGMCWAEAKAA